MKRLSLIVSMILISSSILLAQASGSVKSDREALEDSVIVGGISRPLVEMIMADEQIPQDEIVIYHWAYSEFMKQMSREHLVMFSDQELQEILRYYRTDAYRYVSSEHFLEVFKNNLSGALQYELGENKNFTYALNDVSYGAGIDASFLPVLTGMRPLIDELLSEDGSLMSELRKSGLSQSEAKQLGNAVKECLGHIGDICKLSLVDYVSKESLQEMTDFDLSPLGKKYNIYVQKISNVAELHVMDFCRNLLKEMENGQSVARLKSSIADYVSLSRAFPVYVPELYRPHAVLSVGKDVYEGQTRDQLPHGKGMLTDKKGMVYMGDFKNGKRHGMLEVTMPGKEPELQFWLDDKYQKEAHVGKSKDGKIPYVRIIDNECAGYGVYYDESSATGFFGIFVDGQLNGMGSVSTPDRSGQGTFVDGRLINGLMKWEGNDWAVNEFRGRWNGRVSEGARKWVTKDGRKTVVHKGLFVDGVQEGPGYRSFAETYDTTEISGVFAYGRLYGEGMSHRKGIDKGSGIRSVEVYKGGYFADFYHGEGKVTITLKDIPAGTWHFTRCNVKLPGIVADSVEIRMEGTFDSGAFVRGRVTFSDGSWFEGDFNSSGLAKGKMLRKYSDGSWYEGECRDAKCNGQGTIHYMDGSVFSGVFENGRPVDMNYPQVSDNETYTVPSDAEDERVFKYAESSLSKGQVRLLSPAGVKLMIRTSSPVEVTCRGRFSGETMTEGKVIVSDGTWLEGMFEDGVLIKGRGKTIDKYATVYEGDIVNGYPHGNGKCTYRDGTTFKGKFANGNRMGGTHYAADGTVIKVYR